MILLGMVSLVEYQEVDVFHFQVGVEQTLIQDLRRAHYNHVLLEVLVPGLLGPQVGSHGAKELGNILIQIVA